MGVRVVVEEHAESVGRRSGEEEVVLQIAKGPTGHEEHEKQIEERR